MKNENAPHSLDCNIVKQYLSGRIIPPENAPECDCIGMDFYPEIHAALTSLIAWEKQIIAKYGPLSEEHKKLLPAIDAVLAVCPNAECCQCGSICCPKGDEMHFHHDGCPSC